MSRSSYSFVDQPASHVRLFGRERPVHTVLGGGKVADILLWKDKKVSAAILIGFSIIWFFFEVVEYHFVTLLCHILMGLMITLFIWYNAAGLITWSPPNIHDFQLSDSTCRYFFARINWFLSRFYQISCGKDLPRFFVTIACLWIFSVIGDCFTTLNLLYFMFLCLVTIPIMYERYEVEVEYLANKGNQDVKRLFRKLDSTVLNKIPRGPEFSQVPPRIANANNIWKKGFSPSVRKCHSLPKSLELNPC